MIKNVIFDIGNVLVSFRWKEYYESFGYPEEILKRLIKATVMDPAWNEFDKGVLSEEEVMDIFIQNDPELEMQLRETLSCITEMLGKYDYAIPWVKALKDSGYGVYYLSNFSKKAHEECPDVLGFLPYMDGGILSYQEKITKPDPEIYQRLLNRYGLKAEECVFLDDTAQNVEGALAQGMYAIHFQDKAQADAELQKLGVTLR